MGPKLKIPPFEPTSVDEWKEIYRLLRRPQNGHTHGRNELLAGAILGVLVDILAELRKPPEDDLMAFMEDQT